MLPGQHCICPLPFGPRGGTAGPTVKNWVQPAKSIWLLAEASWKSLLHITGEQIASSPPVSRNFCFGVLVFLACWALLATSPGKPLIFLREVFDYQRFDTFLAGFSHAAFQLPCMYSCEQWQTCAVALRCLVKKLKWGRCVQHRSMNRTWRVQIEDVKYHFKVLD